MPETREVERIRKIYQSYREDGLGSGRWSSKNIGNLAIERERKTVMQDLLIVHEFLPLTGRRILDVGCGNGSELAYLMRWGAEAPYLHGVDLLPEPINYAREAYPGIKFSCGNAEFLDFPNGVFDLVLLMTVLSSILDPAMVGKVCTEVMRVLKPGGAVLFYDLRFSNPSNQNVRGLKRRELALQFPGFCIQVHSLTLLPPLARRLGRWTEALYPVLARIPFLRSHYLGLLVKGPF